RRRCPGRYAADASLWSAMVTMLATVDFSFAKDDQGNVIDFTPKFTTGVTRYLVFLYHFIHTNGFTALVLLRSSPAAFRHVLMHSGFLDALRTERNIYMAKDLSCPFTWSF
ncbi:hypothetical protein EDB19DRAFT_1711157, partial [Suillus lakei]